MDDDEYVELKDGTGRVVSSRSVARYRAEMHRREAAAQHLRDWRAAHPPPPVVGEPCPEEIELDQGADRCPVIGESLNNYWCSRPAEHVGPHIATEGDALGAEVLAVRAE